MKIARGLGSFSYIMAISVGLLLLGCGTHDLAWLFLFSAVDWLFHITTQPDRLEDDARGVDQVSVNLTAGAPLLAQLPIDSQVAAMCGTGEIETVTMAEIPPLLKAYIQAMPVTAHHLA
jgi:hypothetical protein